MATQHNLLQPVQVVRGRGSASRMAHRYAAENHEPFDDGWVGVVDPSATTLAPRTEVRWEDPRSAITYNQSPDMGFDRSLNPYRGCEHGCAYCYARPSHSYLGLSPGLDFETVLIAKRGLADRLQAEIAAPAYRVAPIAIGTVTDAYQPIERGLQLTRAVLTVLHASQHPWVMVTKGSGVERDLDLIAPMGQARQAAVHVTLTTLDPVLARQLEPRAPAPWRRLRTIRTLADAGVPVGVSVAPQIPFLNDDMEQVLAAAREAGATRAFYTVLRLPWELSPLFREWLALHHPLRADRVMARVQELSGGRDYNSTPGRRLTGQGVWADLLRQRFTKTCAKLGYQQTPRVLDTSAFKPPGALAQLDLF
jgi:DNA repair photolyase